jgi:hypothetical protein
VEKQADPGTSSCSRVGRQLGRGLKQLVPGSVPFWALSSCEAKEWVRHQAARFPFNKCVRQGPWSTRR